MLNEDEYVDLISGSIKEGYYLLIRSSHTVNKNMLLCYKLDCSKQAYNNYERFDVNNFFLS